MTSVIVVAPPPKVKPEQAMVRPCSSEVKVALAMDVSTSLKVALEHHLEKVTISQNNTVADTGVVKVGATCHNGGCNKCYEGEKSDYDACTYHPGNPVFHEGMKYWSCCVRKTSDFSSFLQQQGCSSGTHTWVQPQAADTARPCRYDWHQTPSHVTISVFSKNPVPDRCRFHANRVSCDLSIAFDAGSSIFTESFVLAGIINPEKSVVKLMPTKVEVNLKKAEPKTWPSLALSANVDS